MRSKKSSSHELTITSVLVVLLGFAILLASKSQNIEQPNISENQSIQEANNTTGEILVPAVADPELNALKTLTVIEPKRKRY